MIARRDDRQKQRAFMAEILFQVLYNCREQAITLIRRRANSRIVGLAQCGIQRLSFARGSPRRYFRLLTSSANQAESL